MSRKTVTLSVFALLLAVASGRPQVYLNECSGRENGPHADELDSNAFFVCFNGQLIVHSKCDPGELFDAELKTCSGGSADEDATAYLGKSEVGDYANLLESRVSDLLHGSLETEQEARYPNYRPTQTPPAPTPRPSSEPPQAPSNSSSPFTNKIVNVQVTENIFPRSFIVIGRANREQKNK